MNSKTQNLTAQQAREAYREAKITRRIQANRSIIQANLPALDFPNALPNEEGTEENLIPTKDLSSPVTARLPSTWEGAGPATLDVFLDRNEADPIASNTYPNPPMFPLTFEIGPERFTTAGEYTVTYRVTTRAAVEDSDPYRFTVDREDPNRNNEPPALQLDTDRITLDYLTINDGLPFSIPAFDNARPGDYCAIFMTAPHIPEKEVFTTPARPVDNFDSTDPTTGTIPKNQFVNNNGDPLFTDGTVRLSYLAYSRAGNEAKRPKPTDVQMAFLPEPSGLQPAIIPLAAETPPLIDRADAILGVTVDIPEFQNHLPTDEVIISWGTNTSIRFPVGAQPRFPLRSSPVVYPTLIAEGDATGEGPKEVEVTYSIVRGMLGYSPASATLTNVDLRIPGPENPEPGPENPALGSVTVRGGTTTEDNQILVADIGQEVTVTLPILTPPLAENDVLEVIWNGEATGDTYRITGTETDPFTITIPFDVVSKHGDGPAIPVQMSLTSGNPEFPEDNVPLTVETNVLVDTFQLGELTPPSFPDKKAPPFDSIGCGEEIWNGARFKVEGDPVNFAENDTVTVYWQGEVAEDNDEVIPGTEGSKIVTLTAEQVSNGFEERIPFVGGLQAVADADGIMVAWYHLQKTGTPHQAKSGEILVYPAYVTPSGCRCTAEGACPIAVKVQR